MPSFLLTHATLVDGSGAPRRIGDVAVEDGLFVDPAGRPRDSFDSVQDVRGLVCAPGFIDTHSHSDIQVLLDPAVRPKIRQGITTEVLGQDGISAAPLPARWVDAWRKNLSGLDGDADELDWSWRDTKGYLDRIQAGGSATNIVYLVPHGNLRMATMGLDDRKPTAKELDAMCALLETELDALCRVAARHGKPFVVHQRSEADGAIDSMREILCIGRETGVHVHFSHFKICGMRNRHLRGEMANLLDQARDEGIGVSFDQYPYTAGSTTMTALLPPWAQSGGSEELLHRLSDPAARRRIATDIREGIPGWDNFTDFAGPEHIRVTSVHTQANLSQVGNTLAEIAALRGAEVCDVIFDLLFEEKLAVSIATEFGLDEDVAFFMRRPEQNVCTDGLFGAKPHPRVYGSFARVLDKYVKQDNVLTLEEAVFKMAGKPSEVFGLEDRGRIAPGKRADLLLIDMDAVADHATYLDPVRFPEGFVSVWVNGEAVFADGREQNRTPGQVVRLGRRKE